jgi:hypothetical protein
MKKSRDGSCHYTDPQYDQVTKQRLLDKIDKDPITECWNYTGGIKHGYGSIWYKGKGVFAHRISYMVHKGELKDGGMICHHCDNRQCVNPDHLYQGNALTNARDRVRRHKSRSYFAQLKKDGYHYDRHHGIKVRPEATE